MKNKATKKRDKKVPLGNKSYLSLVGRGLDTTLAKGLVESGLTLGKLKQKKEKKLSALGLNKTQIEEIHSENRPPIPSETVFEILYKNKFVCCVCRDNSASVIIHHIKPWEKSRDHKISNLVLLCLNHHGEAHTKKELAQNLDPVSLRKFKKKWEDEVSVSDSQALHLNCILSTDVRWHYINHLRLFELAKSLGITLKNSQYFNSMAHNDYIDKHGVLNSSESWSVNSATASYMYASGAGMQIYAYVKDVIEEILGKLVVKNISNYLSKSEILPIIEKGDFIAVEGKHYFKQLNRKLWQGHNQITKGYRKVNGVEISYTFDMWEATSSSSKACWLAGTRVATSIGRVIEIDNSGDILQVLISVLLIGGEFGNLRTRDYAQMA